MEDLGSERLICSSSISATDKRLSPVLRMLKDARHLTDRFKRSKGGNEFLIDFNHFSDWTPLGSISKVMVAANR